MHAQTSMNCMRCKPSEEEGYILKENVLMETEKAIKMQED